MSLYKMLFGLAFISFSGTSNSAFAAPETSLSNQTYLICKASRNRFHYDWSASSLSSGQEVIDQNNVRYEFRLASQPAGDKGENLKVGECGWAEDSLNSKKKSVKSQVTFKSLSDDSIQAFYKIKNGKVFKVPVRQTKNGLVALAADINILR